MNNDRFKKRRTRKVSSNLTLKDKAVRHSKASVDASHRSRKGGLWQRMVIQMATISREVFLFQVPEPLVPEGKDWDDPTSWASSFTENGSALCRRGRSVWVDLTGFITRGLRAGTSVHIECKSTGKVDGWTMTKRCKTNQAPRLVDSGRSGCVAAFFVRREATGDQYFLPWVLFEYLSTAPQGKRTKATFKWEEIEQFKVPRFKNFVEAFGVDSHGVWNWPKYLKGGWIEIQNQPTPTHKQRTPRAIERETDRGGVAQKNTVTV